jgi:hypothetical protein
VVLLLASAISTFGLVGFTASPASAYCIETGVPELGCVTVCVPGPWGCPM